MKKSQRHTFAFVKHMECLVVTANKIGGGADKAKAIQKNTECDTWLATATVTASPSLTRETVLSATAAGSKNTKLTLSLPEAVR